jgi:uncharacterized protein YukE
MRSTWTWVAALAVALVVADSASAQEGKQRRRGQGQGQGQGRGRGQFGGGMMGGGGGLALLLANEGVQKELKLTDEQTEKVKEFGQSQMEKLREAFGGGGGRPDFEKMREMQKASTGAAEKLVKETLKPEQQKRLKQIQLQQGGLMAFATEEVQKGLKLTDDQKEKLKTLGADMQKDMQELRQGGGGFSPETMQKTRALTKEYMDKAMETLTDDQKKAWKDLTGEPFTVQMQRRRPGGDR